MTFSMQRRVSVHAKYSIHIASHGNQTISFTWPSWWIQLSTVVVINSCQRPSEVHDTQRQTKLTAIPEILLVPTKI